MWIIRYLDDIVSRFFMAGVTKTQFPRATHNISTDTDKERSYSIRYYK